MHIVRAPSGELGFEILAGGGLGRTPILGQVVRSFLPREFLLSYLESILRIYNLEGRRDNIHKARIKILVRSLGIEEFRRRVEADWELTRERGPKVDAAQIARFTQFFNPPAYRMLADSDPAEEDVECHNKAAALLAAVPAARRATAARGESPPGARR